jgi:hypothetical protein
MAKVSMSKSRFSQHLSGEQKIEFINQNLLNATDKNILNFELYFKGKKIEYGVDGPELKEGKIYISVYHFLEFNGIDPHAYDVFTIGNYFTRLTSDFLTVKYQNDDFKINKYHFNFLKLNKKSMEQFKMKK